MRIESFEIILKSMTAAQREALVELEMQHPDLVWTGGKNSARPLRVSVKSQNGRSIAAFNTRVRRSFLRLEFRSRDYDGAEALRTGHRDFDRAYDLVSAESTTVATRIISVIKNNYV